MVSAALLPPGYGAALVSWTLAGVGIGLTYPGLYVLATTPDETVPPAELATAVITAAAVSLALAAGLARPAGLALPYAAFAAVLAAGAVVALRAPSATGPA